MDRTRFARFDLNGDGGFTVVELGRVLRGQASQRCTALLSRLDFDSDGALTVADLDFGSGQRVARLELATLLSAAPATAK